MSPDQLAQANQLWEKTGLTHEQADIGYSTKTGWHIYPRQKWKLEPDMPKEWFGSPVTIHGYVGKMWL